MALHATAGPQSATTRHIRALVFGRTTIKRPKKLPRPFHPQERARVLGLRLERAENLLRALLYYTGFRVSEVARVRLGDISDAPVTLAPGVVWPGSIRTIRKGNKEHVVPLHPDLADLIRDFVLASSRDLSPRTFLLEQKHGGPWGAKDEREADSGVTAATSSITRRGTPNRAPPAAAIDAPGSTSARRIASAL